MYPKFCTNAQICCITRYYMLELKLHDFDLLQKRCTTCTLYLQQIRNKS